MSFEEACNSVGLFSKSSELREVCKNNRMIKFQECEKCSGLGIKEYVKNGKVCGTTFCEDCNSVGGRIVVIEEGIYEQCDKCLGTANILYLGSIRQCSKCNGKGYLDWLERVIGNKNDNTVTKKINTSVRNFNLEKPIPKIRESDIGRIVSIKGVPFVGTPQGWRKIHPSSGDSK